MSARRFSRWWIAVNLLVLLGALCSDWGAAHAAEVRIPAASAQYRLQVERASAAYFGLEASPARLAAQLHQESAWKPNARSPFAEGLAQFTPQTAAWLPEVCPELGEFDHWDAGQAIRGQACYMHWLWRRVDAVNECERWSFALAAYNGGLGWVRRDRRLAEARGADPGRWFGHVDQHSARATWAFTENRGYVERVLLRLEPAYLRAGWPGQQVCP